MRDHDWFDDFMDYKLSGWEGSHHPSAHNSGCLPGILGALFVLCLIATLF